MPRMGNFEGFATITDHYEGVGSTTDYSMYLVINKYFEDFAPIEPLLQLLVNFGKDLGSSATVHVPLKGAYAKTRRSVLRRPWSDKLWEELDREKRLYLLITKKPLSQFKPREDEFIILRFAEAATDPAQYVELFGDIAREIERGTDLFKWRHVKARRKVAGTLLRRLLESIDVKPSVLGIGIDLKTLATGK